MSQTEVTNTVSELVQALNRGDLEGAMNFYADEPTFVPVPGTLLRGKPAIHEALSEMLATGAKITTRSAGAVCANGLALYESHWALVLDGNVLEEAVSADVLQRGPDGRWRVLIDNPWGGDHLRGASDA